MNRRLEESSDIRIPVLEAGHFRLRAHPGTGVSRTDFDVAPARRTRLPDVSRETSRRGRQTLARLPGLNARFR